MLKSVLSLSGAFREDGNVLGLLAFPALAALTYAFCAYGFPRLSAAAQNAIENGVLGMLLGIFGGAVLVGAACATWKSATDIVTRTNK